jgi:hypothetical protein
MLFLGFLSVSFFLGSFFSDVDWLKGVKFSGTFATGGVIPGPLGSPQPIMGHGGELVLNSQQQRDLLNGGGNNAVNTFNINIQGDVSRQTRSEIMKLMPQIALGVNAQNKEAGTR